MIAVIDTETNWFDQVMSMGVAAADSETLQPLDYKYYILTPEYEDEGMYSDRMDLADPSKTRIMTRGEAMQDLKSWLGSLGIRELYAYNARFDKGHLPELGAFSWYDIMKIAAYRQYNRTISPCAQCCTTGRLKRSYGVEPILGTLMGDCSYRETHNAALDALDELSIMRLLKQPLSLYRQCANV